MNDLAAKRKRLEELQAQRAAHDHALLNAAWQARREEAERARVANVIDPSPANATAAEVAQAAFEEAGDAVASRAEHLADLEAAIVQLTAAINADEAAAFRARIETAKASATARLEKNKDVLLACVGDLAFIRQLVDNTITDLGDIGPALARFLAPPGTPGASVNALTDTIKAARARVGAVRAGTEATP